MFEATLRTAGLIRYRDSMCPSFGSLGASRFHSTRWSVVLAAGSHLEHSREALEELCATYWRPIFGFVRRRGHSEEDARDLTQGFFASFLERRDLMGLDPEQGRFRAYLLASVKHFLSNERERERSLKRGGGLQVLSISADDDSPGDFDPADDHTPEDAFERQWALALLRRALDRVRAEQVTQEKLDLFEHLKPTLAGERLERGYAGVAEALGLTPVGVKVAAHRLKKRYGELLMEEVARTVEVPQEIEDELQHLFRALGE